MMKPEMTSEREMLKKSIENELISLFLNQPLFSKRIIADIIKSLVTDLNNLIPNIQLDNYPTEIRELIITFKCDYHRYALQQKMSQDIPDQEQIRYLVECLEKASELTADEQSSLKERLREIAEIKVFDLETWGSLVKIIPSDWLDEFIDGPVQTAWDPNQGSISLLSILALKTHPDATGFSLRLFSHALGYPGDKVIEDVSLELGSDKMKALILQMSIWRVMNDFDVPEVIDATKHHPLNYLVLKDSANFKPIWAELKKCCSDSPPSPRGFFAGKTLTIDQFNGLEAKLKESSLKYAPTIKDCLQLMRKYLPEDKQLEIWIELLNRALVQNSQLDPQT
jgi:hypothetical protein